MRLILLITGLLITLSVPAIAQEAPPTKIYGGYSFFRPEGGGSLHGWHTSFSVNVGNLFEVVSDFSGHYCSQSSRMEITDDRFGGTVTIGANSDVNMHTILFGPRFSLRRSEKLTPFGHVLFGASRLGADVNIRFGNASVDSSFADIGFAMAVGGGLDLRLSESAGLRLFQVDYLKTNFGGTSQGNVRLSVGIILH